MKKAVFFFLTLVLVFTMANVGISTAFATLSGDFDYYISNSTATIIDYMGTGGDLTIPDMLGGYPVASIGTNAFSGCTGLTSVRIPNSVSGINSYTFSDCTGLKQILVDNDSNSRYTSIDGVLFNKSKSTLLLYPRGKTGSYIIPGSVTSIAEKAFNSCTGMTSVTIPDSVASISTQAFSGCTGLTSITIPNSVTNISSFAFSGCTGLASVTIGRSMDSIGTNAFSGCTGLNAAYFLGNAPGMGSNVFYGHTAAFKVYYINGSTGFSVNWNGYITDAFIPPDITPPQLSIGTGGGIYNSEKNIIITPSEDVEIYYTTDGSGPSVYSEKYSNSIFIDKGTILKFMAIDKAGNRSQIYTEVYVIDKIKPVISINISGESGNNEAYKSDVLITLSSEDDLNGSGIARTEYSFDGLSWSIYTKPLAISTEGITKFYYKTTDNAANEEVASKEIKIDKTIPELSIEPVGGIFNTNMAVTVNSSEEAEVYYTTDGSEPSISGEVYNNSTFVEKNTILKFIAVDRVGNKSKVYMESYIIDKVNPITSISIVGEPGNNEWYKSDAMVTLSSTDDLYGSGVAKTEYSFDGLKWNLYEIPLTISTEGITKLYYRAADKAGNEEVVSCIEIKIDKTAPIINLFDNNSLTGCEGQIEVILGSNTPIYWSAFDLCSGLVTASTGTTILDTGSVGKYINTFTAADKAGNVTNIELTYYVIYQYSGILQPIKTDGTSKFKIGSTIPIKFVITDIDNNFIDNAVAKVYLAKVGLEVPTEGETIAALTGAATEGNQFRYDYSSNQYIYNLSTKNLNLSEGEYQIMIKLDDGQFYICDFYLKLK